MMAASAATISSDWPYSASSNMNASSGAAIGPSSLSSASSSAVRSPPLNATRVLPSGSNAGAGAGTGNLSPPGTAASSTTGGGASNSSATSPSLGDLGNTLHSTLSSLSLNSGSTAASSLNSSINKHSSSNTDFTRPSMPMRTPSATSLQPGSAVQISAIGSGRNGTSPPSRNNGLDGLNGSSSIGSPSSIDALSPNLNTGSHQLPLPQLQSQGQRHTPSHSLPWPTYNNNNPAASKAGSLAFLSSANNDASPSSNEPLNARSSIDNEYAYPHFNQRQRQHTNSDNSSKQSHVSQSLKQTNAGGDQTHELENHQSASHAPMQGGNNEEAANNSSRFSLASQPPFNLDHVQLAKSREQRDLDDVDSGQRASATLWMGDLEGWMDETYIKRCIVALGWDRDDNGAQSVQTSVKMIKGASSTSGYCFITFPTSGHAQSVLAHFSKQPPMLMPGSERTFKLNWATGLPGVQPKWEGEYSIFVGDLGREVTEGELVALFTPLFQSTKSAKIMYDPSTGLSRGYGFVRFGDENDMTRSLALGQNNSGSGLSLRGRTLRISEASGSGGSRNRTQSSDMDASANGSNQGKHARDLHIKVPGSNMTGANLLSPNATGFSIPVSSPTSPSMATPPYSGHPQGHNGGSGHATPLSPSSDPTNTTVFVGGLPACISEETLRSFFQHFGEITYVKIPPNKGCGFVQFVRRPDAELAIAKMHDFPIHGKSRIRLSWGRSQGDKQVEHVRKLANALNVPFEAVWRMVQGQDNSTIKQIASAVGGNTTRPGARNGNAVPGNTSPNDFDSARAGLARLASLRSSMGPGGPPPPPGNGPFGDMSIPRGAPFNGMQSLPGPGLRNNVLAGPAQQPSHGPHDTEAYAFRPAMPSALSPAEFGFAGPPRGSDAGPYSRVSPSAFAPLTTTNLSGQQQQENLPMSPSTPGNAYTHQPAEHQRSQHQPMHAYGGTFDPYTPVSIPSPVGNGQIQGNSSSVFDASSNFGPRNWRQQHQGEMSAPSPSFQGALPEFLTNSINGRF